MLGHLSVPGTARGYLYVSFFFLLSGFVLARSSEPRMAAGLTAAQFLKNRYIRLWPVMALGAAISLVLSIADNPWQVVALLFVLDAMMIPILRAGSDLFPLNAPHWSISAELFANAVHVLLLRRLSDRSLAVFVVVAAITLVLDVMLHDPQEWHLARTFWYLDIVPKVMFPYACGVLFARRIGHAETASGDASAFSWLAALVLPTIAVVAIPFAFADDRIGDLVFVLILTPVFFALALRASTPPPAIKRLLAWLGAISFPLYAIHFPICMSLYAMGTSYPYALAGGLLSIVVAHAITVTVESGRLRRATRSGTGALSGRPAQTADA